MYKIYIVLMLVSIAQTFTALGFFLHFRNHSAKPKRERDKKSLEWADALTIGAFTSIMMLVLESYFRANS